MVSFATGCPIRPLSVNLSAGGTIEPSRLSRALSSCDSRRLSTRDKPPSCGKKHSHQRLMCVIPPPGYGSKSLQKKWVPTGSKTCDTIWGQSHGLEKSRRGIERSSKGIAKVQARPIATRSWALKPLMLPPFACPRMRNDTTPSSVVCLGAHSDSHATLASRSMHSIDPPPYS